MAGLAWEILWHVKLLQRDRPFCVMAAASGSLSSEPRLARRVVVNILDRNRDLSIRDRYLYNMCYCEHVTLRQQYGSV